MNLPDPAAETASAAGAASPAPPLRGGGRWSGWAWLVMAAALTLGLVIGVGLALRGRPVLTSPGTDAEVRPTIVVVAASTPAPAISVPVPPADAVAAAKPTAEPVASSVGEEYVVEPGDTMRAIALKAYGDADGWQTIYSANQDRIGANPDALQAGVRLRIPPRR